ncbi:MAG: tRNA(Ile)-lysidine synthase [Chlamydiales bacterium]|nr:tRNA(Ile)-lysidine synthase [Chlamydiales bacterium]MCH9620411.1 tRNA(Ile)-lysidine synthase [Chlamydiales bacterium]MCH9622943.1 tRNA(Ile)-lysidine synthase [Chlamydiales bacterium]
MVEQQFSSFLEGNSLSRPLLALSGGPDSIALFHLMVRAKVAFEVAHVDHGWREESYREAKELEQLCQKHQIPFHLKVLEIKGVNLEDRCRQERLAFFKCLNQHVLVGHHADDQAETVLKRIFEGARLNKLKGLSVVSKVEGVTLYRPLLSVRKEEILEWLDKNKLSYFNDSTNRDCRFLRSRMRVDLLPSLSKSFGKQVEPSLCRLGRLAAELDEHIEVLISSYPVKGVIDFSQNPPKSLFEWRAIVSYLLEKEGLAPSSHLLDQIIFHLRNKSCHKRLRIKNRYVKLNRQTLEIN